MVGGMATCKDLAECKVCHKPYGEKDAANHVGGTEVRGKKDATCTAAGYTGDTYCKGCDTLLSSGTAIPAAGGTYRRHADLPPAGKVRGLRR